MRRARAETELEMNGLKALQKLKNDELSKLKRAEARRRKQADTRGALNAFNKNPFGTIQKIRKGHFTCFRKPSC